MNKRLFNLSIKTLYTLLSAALIFAFSARSFAQTAAGTSIKNTASATYSDGTTSYDAVSNEVSITVAKISGIAITPDAGTLSTTVVPGQTSVPFQFTVTNTGNFTDTINFLANNSSATITGSGTINHIDVGSTTVGSSGYSASVAAGGTLTVTVYVDVSSSAAAGSTIQVFLGDASSGTNYDNIAYSSTSHDVYTTASGAVNGQREARGDRSATVANDAIPNVTLTGPATVTPGSNISYTATGCNTGQRDLSNPYLVIALPNEPTPAETTFAGFTGSSTSYNSSLFYSANGSTWTAATFATLPTSGVNYIKINLTTNPLVAGGSPCEAVTYNVNVPSSYDATNPVNALVTLYGTNSLGTLVSDISGAGASGTPTVTNVSKIGGPYLGPNGQPEASGPGTGGTTNNDVTEKTAVLSPAVAPGTATTSTNVVTFTNTLENKGNATDTFTFTAPTRPAGSTVEVSFDNGTTWVTLPASGTTVTSPSVVKDGTLQVLVKVTLPSGTLSGNAYDTVVTATSVNENTKSNSTIDRILLGGFINLNKSVSCANQCEPGDTITYVVTFTNFSTTLTATGLVVTENGTTAPNNWGTYTTATGTPAITGVSGASASYNTGNTILTSTSMSVAPGASGTLTFQRIIN